MASDDDGEFKILMRRSGSRGHRESFVNQVLRATRKAGDEGSALETKGSPRRRYSTFGRGRTAFSRSRLFGAQRQVAVKARVAHHQGRPFRLAPLSNYVAYLERDDVTSSGQKARVFGANEDRANATAFAGCRLDDRHHFRFILVPEEAAEMTDLKTFTRDLAAQVKSDLGTRLDWGGIDHWNTDNPCASAGARQTSEPDVDEAGRFADAIHPAFPGKLLAYNCSPSFNWRKKLSPREFEGFQRDMARMGYRFQFVRLAAFHSLNLSMFNRARDYSERGMAADSELQESEFLEAAGYTATRHQREVSIGYFDAVAMTISATTPRRSPAAPSRGSFMMRLQPIRDVWQRPTVTTTASCTTTIGRRATGSKAVFERTMAYQIACTREDIPVTASQGGDHEHVGSKARGQAVEKHTVELRAEEGSIHRIGVESGSGAGTG